MRQHMNQTHLRGLDTNSLLRLHDAAKSLAARPDALQLERLRAEREMKLIGGILEKRDIYLELVARSDG